MGFPSSSARTLPGKRVLPYLAGMIATDLMLKPLLNYLLKKVVVTDGNFDYHTDGKITGGYE